MTQGRILPLLLVMIAAMSSPAAAQTRRAPARTAHQKWEVEGHAGGALGNRPGSATHMPEAGALFSTFLSFPTRMVPSWYFGDGTKLFNEYAAATGFSSRLTPLDGMLSTSSIGPRRGADFGFRVARVLTSRFAAEFSLDVKPKGLAFSDEALNTIESARSSFQSGFEALVARVSTNSGRVVTSIKTIQAANGNQVVGTGALNINLRTHGRFLPYATIGAGAVSQTARLPTVSLTGDYRYVSATNTPYRQTDSVVVSYGSDPTMVFLLGGGLRWPLSSRSGVRGDVRAYVGPNHLKVLLDGTPRTIAGTPQNVFQFTGNPAIQISTQSAFESSLSGPALSKYEVADGRGVQVQMTATVGYYWRF